MFYPCVRSLVAFSLPGIFLAPLHAQVGDKNAEAIRQDHAMIQGKWKVTRMVDSGKEAHDHDLQKIFVINGNDGSWSLVGDGKVIAKGPSTINPAAKPRTIDFHIIEENGKRVDFQGIYDLGASKRKLCFAPKEKGRPKAFEAPKDSGSILVEFEKVQD